MQCGKTLTRDETAIYRRLINRGAQEYLCIDCLASHFKCPRAMIEQKIEHFKSIGCTLFL